MFFKIYFILVLISSVVWLICCNFVPKEENKYFDNILSVALINCLCLPLILFSYFVICGTISKFKNKSK